MRLNLKLTCACGGAMEIEAEYSSDLQDHANAFYNAHAVCRTDDGSKQVMDATGGSRDGE